MAKKASAKKGGSAKSKRASKPAARSKQAKARSAKPAARAKRAAPPAVRRAKSADDKYQQTGAPWWKQYLPE